MGNDQRKNDNKIIDSLARIETSLGAVVDITGRHDEALYGNGKEGVVTEVSNLKLRWGIAKYVLGGASFLIVAEILSEVI